MHTKQFFICRNVLHKKGFLRLLQFSAFCLIRPDVGTV